MTSSATPLELLLCCILQRKNFLPPFVFFISPCLASKVRRSSSFSVYKKWVINCLSCSVCQGLAKTGVPRVQSWNASHSWYCLWRMGRTVIAEESVQEGINGLFKDSTLRYGLLVGQFTSAKTFVLTSVPTPEEEENDKRKGKTSSSLSIPWAVEHARQVCK